ncbi:helix-turn-helix domain-containing protein [Bdellovibrio bacteriovorus]|uniref:helix-turn-helix domain-containing protein n=1 Tax=Bdellovibrio bacteriovorus TaxID=959 RepID=UPI0021D06FCF|nr:helix-turn-helix domain-containing protein [Bdellovibrio bacteriovorus]UXR65870.1 helix-turn-helix domain-containing protein [Bdellovibrio bacteriovorus]
MKKAKAIVTRSAEELAEFLGLPASEGLEIKIRSDLNDKIIAVVGRKGLTHAQVAKLAGTSRTRITALLNRHTQEISTDLMLRVLGSLGIKAKIVFQNVA